MAGLHGKRGGLRAAAWEAKSEKSFREIPNPLKSNQTAKTRIFRTQGYQGFSKTQYFSDETFSVRLGGAPADKKFGIIEKKLF